jgi:hypothetical protein
VSIYAGDFNDLTVRALFIVIVTEYSKRKRKKFKEYDSTFTFHRRLHQTSVTTATTPELVPRPSAAGVASARTHQQ